MPTICSSCGRTSGKCQSCIKVDAALTPERIKAVREKALTEWVDNDFEPSLHVFFARAISREVVAILARHPLSHEVALRLSAMHGKHCPVYEAVELIRATERQHDISTPAASGIGESGGEG